MPITDYDSLKAAVLSFVARSDAKFQSQFDIFLEHGEKLIYNGYGSISPIRLQDMVTEQTIVAVGGEFDLPTDYCEMISISNPINHGYPLEFRPAQEFFGYSSGDPAFYTVIGNKLKLLPKYSGDIDLVYWKKYPALTQAATNDLLVNHSDIYLEAVLIRAYAYLRDTEQEGLATQRLKGLISALKKAELAKSHSGNMSRMVIRGGFNGGFDQ